MCSSRRGAYSLEGRLDKFDVKAQRLVALCMLGVLLFNYPLLAVFNVTGTVFGVPVLYAYIFSAWTLLTAGMAYVIETKS